MRFTLDVQTEQGLFYQISRPPDPTHIFYYMLIAELGDIIGFNQHPAAVNLCNREDYYRGISDIYTALAARPRTWISQGSYDSNATYTGNQHNNRSLCVYEG